MKKNIDLVFDKLFKESYGKNKLIFDNYKFIYNLPTVTSDALFRKNYINTVSERNILFCF